MATGNERPSRWVPISDPVDLAHLGKLAEELGELSAIVARCIIQGGVGECDPETGKLNRDALAEEIADVHAMMLLAVRRFKLDEDAIQARAERKVRMKMAWHAMLADPMNEIP